jgi:hypothetical protein
MYTKVAMEEVRLVNKLIREANKVVVEVTGGFK